MGCVMSIFEFSIKLRTIIAFLCANLIISFSAQEATASSKTDAKISKAKVDDVSVIVGRPRHWTLDDAHYLLSGLHRRARDLTISSPGPINPNGDNGLRYSTTQTEFGLSASFDQIKGLENSINKKNLENNIADLEQAREDEVVHSEKITALSTERLELKKKEADLRAQSVGAQGRLDYNNTLIQSLNGKLPALQKLEDQPQIDQIKEKIESITIENETLAKDKLEIDTNLNSISSQISLLDSEISDTTNKLTAAKNAQNDLSAKFSKETPDSLTQITSQLDPSSTKTGIENLSPSYPPSVILDNYVNTENIALAKKLTLLRNHIGEDKTVVFLELPQSFQTAKKRSDNRHVQVFWKVDEYCTRIMEEVAEFDAKLLVGETLEDYAGSRYFIEEMLNEKGFFEPIEKYGANRSEIKELLLSYATYGNTRNVEFGILQEGSRQTGRQLDDQRLFALVQKISEELQESVSRNGTIDYLSCSDGDEEDNSLYQKKVEGNSSQNPVAWDLIPSTDAYNISDFDYKQRKSAVGAVFSFLTGIGLDANYKRSAEMFERFKTQDVFASAFGQGNSEFGWVFNPKPGSKRIVSGPKSSYATLTVPRTASLLKLKAVSCIFSTKEIPYSTFSDVEGKENCRKVESFSIPLKNNTSFWIDSLRYRPVKETEVQTAIFTGRRFSPFQLSVLVDGTPLPQFDNEQVSYKEGKDKKLVASIAEVNRAIEVPSKGASGYFQVTNPQTVSLHFRMPAGYKGTPEIVFVTPSKTVALNQFYFNINGREGVRLEDLTGSQAFFGRQTEKVIDPTISIDSNPHLAKVGNSYSLLLTGNNFATVDKVIINGVSSQNGCHRDKVSLDDKNPECAFTVVSNNVMTVMMADRPSWPVLLLANHGRGIPAVTAVTHVTRPKG